MKNLQSTKFNLISIIFTSIFCFFLFLKSGVLDNVGMAALFLNWLPLLIGLFTILFYFITKQFLPKYAWIVSLLGILLNILLLINAFLEV